MSIYKKAIYILCSTIFLVNDGQLFSSELSSLETKFVKAKLVDIQTLDPTIQVDLKYSKVDNFMGIDFYGDLEKCYLQKEVAQKLVVAQKKLREINPKYSLIVFDCARPRSVQEKMWESVKGTCQQEFVANPRIGSMHNFGAAVDLSIVDENGAELDMGTPFDFFGDMAKPTLESKFIKSGKLNKSQLYNRQLLRSVMLDSGFVMSSNEWWHFNGFPSRVVREKYQLIE